MNKKLISTAILTLGLLQGAGVAYAGSIYGQIGGDGAGNIFNLAPDAKPNADLTVSDQVGSLSIKLNIFARENAAQGDAFITAAIKGQSLIMDNFNVGCELVSVKNTLAQQDWRCKYVATENKINSITFKSAGQCVPIKWPNDNQVAMACAWTYVFTSSENPEQTQVFVAPVSYSLIAPVSLT